MMSLMMILITLMMIVMTLMMIMMTVMMILITVMMMVLINDPSPTSQHVILPPCRQPYYENNDAENDDEDYHKYNDCVMMMTLKVT